MAHSSPLRFLTRALLIAGLPTIAIACSGVDDPTAPNPAFHGQLSLALVNETGAGMVCGTDAPVAVTVTTTDRRGRVVPAAGALVNFRAVDKASEVFAGAAITNASGQAGDRVTAGMTPGSPVRLEVRSVDAAGTATTHLALTRPVLMGPTASIQGQAVTGGPIAGLSFVTATVRTGCTLPNGQDAVLAKGTPMTVTVNGASLSTTFDGVNAATTLAYPGSLTGQQVTITAGDASTGILTTTFTVTAPVCTNPILCI